MTFISKPKSNYHDLTYSPVGLWNFSSALTDSSGNNFTLAVANGVERYTSLFPGNQALLLDGATKLLYNTTGSALQITGDITVECIVYINNYTAKQCIITYGSTSASDGTAAGNYLYSIYTSATRGFLIHTENGTSVTSDYSLTTFSAPNSQPFHLAFTRTSNVYTIYINGNAVGTSSALTTPTSGTSSKLYIGGDNETGSTFLSGSISSLKIINSALTSAQIKGEYNLTLGPVLGYL